MDILYDISYLLCEGLENRKKDDPEYRACHQLENRILSEIDARVGDELVDKLTDAQVERMEADRLFCFLQGLRLGVELLRLQGF